MVTNIDLITKALLEICVINESETPSAEQASDALTTLNQMMEEWDEAGLKLGWAEQTSTTDTTPLPPYAERGVILMLALALAPSYGGAASVSQALISGAQMSYDRIQRKCLLAGIKPRDSSTMPAAEGGSATFDITRGY